MSTAIDLPNKDLCSHQEYRIYVNGQYVESAGKVAAFAARAFEQWRRMSKKRDTVTWLITPCRAGCPLAVTIGE